MSSFARDLQRHLGEYKSSRLGVTEAGLFLHKGRTVRHRHILPTELKWLNILEPFRAEVRRYLNDHREIHLHKHFNHLNSSQALAFNLFFPFFEKEPPFASALLSALGTPGQLKTWRCEYLPDIVEGTNVDVAWQVGEERTWTYCELKLSEAEFGQAKIDGKHYRKLEEIYGPTLRPHCAPELLEPACFFRNYQILRNIWMAARKPTGRTLFLMPLTNKALWAPLRDVLSGLSDDLQARVQVAELEETIERLVHDSALEPRMRWYAELLREKYVLQ